MKCCAWRYSIWSLIHFIAKVGVAPAMACPQLRISAWQLSCARSCVGSHPIDSRYHQISMAVEQFLAVQQWAFETEAVFSPLDPLEVRITPWMSVQSILCLIGIIPWGDSDGNDGNTVSYVLLLKNAQRNLGKSVKTARTIIVVLGVASSVSLSVSWLWQSMTILY